MYIKKGRPRKCVVYGFENCAESSSQSCWHCSLLYRLSLFSLDPLLIMRILLWSLSGLLSPSDQRSFVQFHYQELHRHQSYIFAFVNYCAPSHMLTH